MTAKFFALLTNQGAAKLANATALGTQVQITQMGVGDGGGVLPTPNGAQTALVNEKRRSLLNALSVDAANSNQIIAEQIIPENEGGFWIREIGLYDSENTLIAVANCPETYKPMLAEGSGRTQTVRMILIINSTDAVTLKIDPSVVLATRHYVDDKVIEVKAYADDLLAKHVAAANPHAQYANEKAMQTALGKLMAKAENGADIADVAKFLKNLGLGAAAKKDVGTAAGQLPDMSSFTYQNIGGVIVARFPSGLTIQVGAGTTVAGIKDISLPVAVVDAFAFAGESAVQAWSLADGVYSSFTIYGTQVTSSATLRVRCAVWRNGDRNFIPSSAVFHWFVIGKS